MTTPTTQPASITALPDIASILATLPADLKNLEDPAGADAIADAAVAAIENDGVTKGGQVVLSEAMLEALQLIDCHADVDGLLATAQELALSKVINGKVDPEKEKKIRDRLANMLKLEHAVCRGHYPYTIDIMVMNVLEKEALIADLKHQGLSDQTLRMLKALDPQAETDGLLEKAKTWIACKRIKADVPREIESDLLQTLAMHQYPFSTLLSHDHGAGLPRPMQTPAASGTQSPEPVRQ